MKRRTLIAAAAWTAPAVTMAAAAPAYATSSPGSCAPLGCRHPGETRRHAYRVADCGDTAITAALIDADTAVQREDGGWWVERNDSRHALTVTTSYADGTTWTGVVGFPPHTGDGAHTAT